MEWGCNITMNPRHGRSFRVERLEKISSDLAATRSPAPSQTASRPNGKYLDSAGLVSEFTNANPDSRILSAVSVRLA